MLEIENRTNNRTGSFGLIKVEDKQRGIKVALFHDASDAYPHHTISWVDNQNDSRLTPLSICQSVDYYLRNCGIDQRIYDDSVWPWRRIISTQGEQESPSASPFRQVTLNWYGSNRGSRYDHIERAALLCEAIVQDGLNKNPQHAFWNEINVQPCVEGRFSQRTFVRISPDEMGTPQIQQVKLYLDIGQLKDGSVMLGGELLTAESMARCMKKEHAKLAAFLEGDSKGFASHFPHADLFQEGLQQAAQTFPSTPSSSGLIQIRKM